MLRVLGPAPMTFDIGNYDITTNAYVMIFQCIQYNIIIFVLNDCIWSLYVMIYIGGEEIYMSWFLGYVPT